MKNPWIALKQFWENVDLEGRAKFNNLPGEEAINTATVYQALTMAALCSSCLMVIHFLMFAIWIMSMPDERGNIHAWLTILTWAFGMGWIQGSFLGGSIGFSQAKLWQGDKSKAGSNCAFQGATMIVALAITFVRAYDNEYSFASNLFIWFLFSGPGFLLASGMVAWGIKARTE